MNPTVPASAPTPPKRPARLIFIAQIVVVLVIIGLVIGIVPRMLARHRLLTENHAGSATTVVVVSPST
jgi:protein-S-isoprenylcysteine O-methyltransferase Ste14